MSNIFTKIKNLITNKLESENERTILVRNNIFMSFANKLLSAAISFIIVSVTVNYLNKELYGIWVTISSFVVWITFFDFGLVHGFRNRFSEIRILKDDNIARKYVSTTYFLMLLITIPVTIIAQILNMFIDWSNLLGIGLIYNHLIRQMNVFLFLFVSIQLVLGVIQAMLTADQKSAYSAFITTCGQILSLLSLLFIIIFSKSNFILLTISIYLSPLVILFIFSIILFKKEYKSISPNIKYIDIKLAPKILGLGSKFFIIQVSMLFIFQVVNIMILRILGADSVTYYSVVYKYFSIMQMIFIIILSPFWSAYTDAYAKGDHYWMKEMFKKLTRLYISILALGLLLLLLSPIAYDIWLMGEIDSIPFSLSFSMFIYMSILTYSNMLMTLINGTGKILLQLIIYIFFGMITIPLLHYACLTFRLEGAILIMSAVYLFQALIARIQLDKILNKKEKGIWSM